LFIKFTAESNHEVDKNPQKKKKKKKKKKQKPVSGHNSLQAQQAMTSLLSMPLRHRGSELSAIIVAVLPKVVIASTSASGTFQVQLSRSSFRSHDA
jgi:hypothetical protein